MTRHSRRSRRELVRAVDNLDEGDGLPVAGLITVYSSLMSDEVSVELVDRQRRLVDVDGVTHRLTRNAADKMFDVTR
jgi:hypothetical protein